MANKPAYDPTDPRYYDEKDLRSEVERVFSVCADCRMCVKYLRQLSENVRCRR